MTKSKLVNLHLYNSEYFTLQAVSCLCHTCNTYKDRLHSCLHCIFFGCYVKGHIQDHAKTKKHFLGNLERLALSMLVCDMFELYER